MQYFFLCILFTIAAADYGAPQEEPSYNPPVASYNPPAVVAQPVYVQVQPPAPLPNMPGSHEFLFKRKRHSGSRSSSSEERGCRRCKDLKTKCDGEDNCHKPKISYIKCDGCRRAIISCKGTSSQQLKTIDGDILASGVGVEKVVKCGKHGWTAKDTQGNKVDFKHAVCYGPQD